MSAPAPLSRASSASSGSPSPPSPSLSLSDSASGPGSSAPSSVHTPTTHLLLLSPALAHPAALGAIAAPLERGAGDVLLLCVDGEARPAPEDEDEGEDAEVKERVRTKSAFVQAALRKIRAAMGMEGVPFVSTAGEWRRERVVVGGREVVYLVARGDAEAEAEAEKTTDDIKDDPLAHMLTADVLDAHAPDAHDLAPAPALALFAALGLRSVFHVAAPRGMYALHMLEKPAVAFPPLSSPVLARADSAAAACEEMPSTTTMTTAATSTTSTVTGTETSALGPPTEDEWTAVWAAWDAVTLGMIPRAMLLQKPIDLRHPCLFYIGHIPTFLDMLLSKTLDEPNTEPKSFTTIFERGIDPHVDDPDHCHSHSEIPQKDEDWPALGTILAFRDAVRSRLLAVYADVRAGRRVLTRRLARTLVMTLEHEGWHVETLLYMLIQRADGPAAEGGTRAPPGTVCPPWAALAEGWERERADMPPARAAVQLGPARVVLGHDDAEPEDLREDVATDEVATWGHAFGWDNESPARTVQVGAFRAEWAPVSNGEFYVFWRAGEGKVGMPPSWVLDGDDVKVRTLHGPVPLAVARHWPVLTAHDDLAAFARAHGGRLPSEPELRLFLDTFDVGHAGGANVGMRHWHPVPPTTGRATNGGRGSNGGVWEWTTTLLEGHEGMAPTGIFPGYSSDFFDGKHHVVLGASYATIPRLAGRRTVRNFYQHNYPYPWVGARVVYDV